MTNARIVNTFFHGKFDLVHARYIVYTHNFSNTLANTSHTQPPRCNTQLFFYLFYLYHNILHNNFYLFFLFTNITPLLPPLLLLGCPCHGTAASGLQYIKKCRVEILHICNKIKPEMHIIIIFYIVFCIVRSTQLIFFTKYNSNYIITVEQNKHHPTKYKKYKKYTLQSIVFV